MQCRRALAILNPNQPGCTYPEKSLCGAAIALKLAQALLERRDAARTREKTLPSFLKMAAIATIADAVPLRGENRVIAALGLRELRSPAGAGLRALFAAAALDPATKQITGFDVAFRLAPRINAAGRMDVASEVIELFSHARRGPRHRTRRQSSSASTASAAIPKPPRSLRFEARLAEDAELAADRLLRRRWRRLAPRRHRHSRLARGGAHRQAGYCGQRRRWRGARLGPHRRWISAAQRHRELRRSVHALWRPRLRRRLRHACGNSSRAQAPPAPCTPRIILPRASPSTCLRIHAELPLDRITPVLAGWLRKLEPLGHGNPEPIFVARESAAASPRRAFMKERHIRLELAQEHRAASRRPAPNAAQCAPWAGTWPRAPPSSACAQGSLIDVAYRIRENDHPAIRRPRSRDRRHGLLRRNPENSKAHG